MSLARLRAAEWIALLGALVLFVVLFLDWFSASLRTVGARGGTLLTLELNTTGWASLGWFLVLLLAICMVLTLALCALIAAGADDAVTLPPAVALPVIGVPTLLILVIVVATQPGLGLGLPGSVVDVEPAAWAGVSGALLMVGGAIVSLRDERTTGADRRFTPPPARPAPPAA